MILVRWCTGLFVQRINPTLNTVNILVKDLLYLSCSELRLNSLLCPIISQHQTYRHRRGLSTTFGLDNHNLYSGKPPRIQYSRLGVLTLNIGISSPGSLKRTKKVLCFCVSLPCRYLVYSSRGVLAYTTTKLEPVKSEVLVFFV